MFTRWLAAALAAAGVVFTSTPQMALAQRGHGGGHAGGAHGAAGMHGGYNGGYHGGYAGGYHGGYPGGYGGYRGYSGYHYGGWGGTGLYLGLYGSGFPGYFGYGYAPSYYGGYSSYPYYDYSYSPAYDYSYAAPSITYGSPPVVTSSSAYTPSADTAILDVRVPDPNAEVLIDGQATAQRGTVREFVSPSLQSGLNYSYQVTVRWRDSAGPHEESRNVPVQPGQKARVDFSTASGTGPAKGG